MGLFNKLAREDGFYAGNITKSIHGEYHYFFILIFFIRESIFYQLEEVNGPINLNKDLILGVKERHYKFFNSIQRGEFNKNDFPNEMATYREIPESLKAEFKDGTDTIKLTLYPTLFSGVVLDLELEGIPIEWLKMAGRNFENRKIIDKAKLKFYRY